jgi:hypothetical protein
VHEEIIPARHAGALEPVLLWMLERDPSLRPTMPQAERALRAVESGTAESVPEQVPADRTVPLADAPPPVEATKVDAVPAAAPVAAAAGASAGASAAPESGAGSGAAPGVEADPAPRKRFPPATRRRALIAALVAALLLGLGGWGLSVALSDHSTAKATGSTTPTGHASASAAPPPASPRPSHASGSKGSAAASASPSAPATSTPPQQSRADQLTSTITDYYQLVPGNLSKAWTWMTADYQQNHAGGWSGYTSFWSKIHSVAASDVTATLPSTVTAMITYHYNDGSTVRERTQFGLVFQQNRWLIASSSVLG